MKWRLITSVLVAAMILCVAGPVAADQQFGCTDQSCTFSVPDSYSPVQNDASAAVFLDALSGGTFTVGVQDGSMFNSLDDAVAGLQQQVSTGPGYQPGSNGISSLVVGGNPAQSFSYMVNNSSGLQVEQAVFASLYHSKLYILAFSTTPQNEDAFVSGAQGVFSSWQFT